MIKRLQKSLFFLLGSVLLSSVVPAATLAVDNLEPNNDLNQASLMGSFLRENYFPDNALKTDLLAVCCPSGESLGTIDFCLETPQQVALCIFDQQGREIAQLLDGTVVSGSHQAWWDGCRKDGQDAPGGTYFLMMKTEESVFLKRMVLDR